MRRDASSIPDFWHAVELFSPQTVPPAAPDHPSMPVVRLREGDPAPWAPGHPLRQRPLARGRTWRYQVFGGVLPLEAVGDLVHERLGLERRAHDVFPNGATCLFALRVDANGHPLTDSLVLSSCAWATGRCLRAGGLGPEVLDGFEAASLRFEEAFRERLIERERHGEGRDAEGEGFNASRPLDVPDLLEEVRHVGASLGLASLLAEPVCRVRVTQVPVRPEPGQQSGDPLNSFFLRDLRRVSAAVRADDVGAGLVAYLDAGDTSATAPRIDLRTPEGRCVTAKALEPASFPSGRWPVAGGHPLVSSQQFAVNAIARDLGPKRGGLFAVNGPPGTGKTTLLRDLVAMIVVRRARAMARLSSPAAAFEDPVARRHGKRQRRLHALVPSLRGHEIVVASSNNGAVENVSLEMPASGAIDAAWLDTDRYFEDLAARVTGEPAWGLVAARLGNSANRRDFVSRFWYGERDADPDEPFADGFRVHLTRVASTAPDWPSAKVAFETASAAEAVIRAEREALVELRDRRERAADAWRLDESARERVLDELADIAESRHETDAALERAAAAHDEALRRRRTHREFSPRLLEIVFTLGRALRRWRARDAELEADLVRADRERGELVARRDELDGARVRLTALLESLVLAVARAFDDWTRLGTELDARCEAAGIAPPPDPDERCEDERELDAPWADRRWDEARAALFLAALELHRAFIEANAVPMRDNLDAAMDLLGGLHPKGESERILGSLWSTLFLVVPVVSTTFASFDRTFASLSRESLGWLLIDEAGQAVPQAAAGALWRARRTVVVGDPLQLEPVVTVPSSLQDALRRAYRVEPRWLPGDASVQVLADRTSRYGTELRGEQGPVWVGAPLRVHRRCDAAPFELANAIAYDGLMVFGTPARAALALPPSAWIDVRSTESRGHWIPAEGAAMEALLDTIVRGGVAHDDVFLISPFRDVVQELRRSARGRLGMRAGTIHTVQGREADVVVLVLGSDPARGGARNWAAATPNLLNVAATRARRRLYVIGDRAAWGRLPHFDVAVRRLDTLSVEVLRDETAPVETAAEERVRQTDSAR